MKQYRSAEEQLAHIRAKNALYARRWRAKHPERAAEIAHRYWSRKLSQIKAASGEKAESEE